MSKPRHAPRQQEVPIMTSRFPLYAKILLWFFLNGVIVLAVFAVSLASFYDLRLDRMLWRGAYERLSPIRQLLADDLAEAPPAEWDVVLERFHLAYRVDFYLFDGEGGRIAGPAIELPPEIKERLNQRQAFMRRWNEQVNRAREAESPPSRERPSSFRDGSRSSSDMRSRPSSARWEPPPFIQRTADPKQYWVVDRVHLPSDGKPETPVRLTLLIRSSSITGSGLWLDLNPVIMTGLVAAALSILLWFPMVRGITQSLAQMNQASRRIAEGRFDVRVSTRRRDEIGALGVDINQMAQRLQGLVDGQKRFLGDVAHELCSPLARLQMALGILDQHTDPDRQSYLNSASENARHMAELVNELLSFSKAALGAATLDTRPVAVGEIIGNAIRRETVGSATIEVETEDGLHARADPELLQRALGNLLRNAVRYAGDAGPIRVEAVARDQTVRITVTDAGPGVPDNELDLIFDPFFRHDSSRDPATGGVGLGLTIVKTCIESCGGTISARNRVPHGLEVALVLQRATAPVA